MQYVGNYGNRDVKTSLPVSGKEWRPVTAEKKLVVDLFTMFSASLRVIAVEMRKRKHLCLLGKL